LGDLPPFFFLACSAVFDDDVNSYSDEEDVFDVIGLENVLWKLVVTRGADDDENFDGTVKHSEGVMPSATRRIARGRTSFMVAVCSS